MTPPTRCTPPTRSQARSAVINTATCNATDTAGCAAAPAVITIGAGPGPPVLDQATGTLYVPYGEQHQPGRRRERRDLQRHRHRRLRTKPGRGQGRAAAPTLSR